MSQGLPPGSNDNPFAAPEAELIPNFTDLGGDQAEAERIRRTYIGHEASVRSIGSLFFLGTIFAVIGAGFLFYMLILSPADLPPDADRSESMGLLAIVIGLIVVYALLGTGLRGLKSWARWGTTVLVGLTVLANMIQLNPFGLLIGGFILYLLLSPKATVVFSPAYKEVIAKTPHVRYRTSLIVKVALGLLILVLILAVVGGVMSVFR